MALTAKLIMTAEDAQKVALQQLKAKFDAHKVKTPPKGK